MLAAEKLLVKPKKASAFRPGERRELRRLYAQSELPMRVIYSGCSRRVGWLVEDILTLDLQYYLPLFVTAFREPDEPFGFLALEASLDVLSVAGPAGRVLTLGPLVSKPLKLALRSKDAAAAERGLRFLQAFVDSADSAAMVLDLDAVSTAVQATATEHARLKPLATRLLAHHLPRLSVRTPRFHAASPRRRRPLRNPQRRRHSSTLIRTATAA